MTYSKKTVGLVLLLTVLLSIKTQAQYAIPWCKDLYIGDVRLPTNSNLDDFRDVLRSIIGEVLSETNSCTFIERDPGLENLMDREDSYFTNALDKLHNQGQFRHRIEWAILGQVTPTHQQFEYSLEVRIIRVTSRTSQHRFTYQFRFDENSDLKTFKKEFRVYFFDKVNQLLTISGRLSPAVPITESNLDCTPPMLPGTFELNQTTGRFSYKVPRYKLAYDSINVQVYGTRMQGQIRAPIKVKADTPKKRIDIGDIIINITTGLFINLPWQDGMLKKDCDDFEIQKITFQSSSTFLFKDSVYYSKTPRGFQIEIQKTLPTDTRLNIEFSSQNYPYHTNANALQLSNASSARIQHGAPDIISWRKFIPGLQQLATRQEVLGTGIFLTGVTLFGLFADRLSRGNMKQREANNSSSLATREYLNQQARDLKNQGTLFLITAGALYVLQLWHGAKVRSCKRYKKNEGSYSLMPSYSAGTIGLALNVSLGH